MAHQLVGSQTLQWVSPALSEGMATGQCTILDAMTNWELSAGLRLRVSTFLFQNRIYFSCGGVVTDTMSAN